MHRHNYFAHSIQRFTCMQCLEGTISWTPTQVVPLYTKYQDARIFWEDPAGLSDLHHGLRNHEFLVKYSVNIHTSKDPCLTHSWTLYRRSMYLQLFSFVYPSNYTVTRNRTLNSQELNHGLSSSAVPLFVLEHACRYVVTYSKPAGKFLFNWLTG